MREMPDEPAVVALVDRAVSRRDQAAFAELYDRYLPPVYRYLYFRVGHRAEAEDLAEQVFLKAWQAIQRFQWRGKPFLAWLYQVAHNVLVDHLRRRRPTTSMDGVAAVQSAVDEHASTDLSRVLDADVLSGAVRQLTEDQQQVILLHFVGDLRTAQIAQIMNKEEGAIRALQLRALVGLRRVLEGQGERGSA
ncbi:MAG: sigma-70 family RNA polymerase sigma factor [Chloroflexota bacterium]|nr:sigma-70 family RNA polymerase sigma factor [Chloroflexota bacterium]